MAFIKDFKEFTVKGNVVDLAVAVVIGGAFGKIVSALVDDLVMPLVGVVMPAGDWRNYSVTPLHFKVGHLAGAVIDFFLIALVLFLVVKKLMTLGRKPAAPVAPMTRSCPECLEPIPIAAHRCRACGQVVPAT